MFYLYHGYILVGCNIVEYGVVFIVDLLLDGLVAQWIRHLTTNQGIAGSSPARVNKLFVNILFLFML